MNTSCPPRRRVASRSHPCWFPYFAVPADNGSGLRHPVEALEPRIAEELILPDEIELVLPEYTAAPLCDCIVVKPLPG